MCEIRNDAESSLEQPEGQGAEVIILQKPEAKGCRITLTVSEETADAWKKFTAPLPYKQIPADAAIRRFMEDAKAGKVVFEMKV